MDDDDSNFVPGNGAESTRARPRKTADAFRTISEVADELHVPQHVLRFWETKFPQVRPLKRGGGRRYYRPEDVVLLRRVADLLYTQGYTIKGVQRLLRDGGGALGDDIPPASAEERAAAAAEREIVPASAEAESEPPPQLLIPGLPEELRVASQMPRPAKPTSSSAEREAERLRGLLRETLLALEELRRMLG